MRIVAPKAIGSPGAQTGRATAIVTAELLLLVLVAGAFVWLAAGVYGVPYLPASEISDGIGYFVGAKSFYLNHQLRAPLIHLDLVSPIGDFYSHGFAYSLLNGGAALLVDWHDKLIIAINLVLLATAAIFILTAAQELRWKLILLLLFLTYYLTPTMVFAYMQETVHLLLALVLGRLLMRIIDLDEVGRNRDLVACYYILIAAFALLRPTWVFWAVGLVAIARSKRDLVLFGSLAILFVGIGYLYLKLFFAPYPYYAPYQAASAALADHRWTEAAEAALEAVRQNAAKLFTSRFYIFGETWIPNAYTWIIIGLTAYLYGCYRYQGDRRALAVALIATCYFAAVLLVYDVLAGARTVAVVFVLQLGYLAGSRKTALVTGLAVLQLAMFPTVLGIATRIIGYQTRAGEYAIRDRAHLQKVRDIVSAIKIGRRATIYLDNAFTNGPYPLSIHLPLRSDDGYALRYSQDVTATRPMSDRTFDKSFLDFVLAAEPLSRQDATPVYDADGFHLYRVRND